MTMDSNRWRRGVGVAGLAGSALVAGAIWAADEEAPRAEKHKIVIQRNDEPEQVFEWDGDADVPEVIRIGGGPWLGVTLAEEKEAGSGAKVTSVVRDSPADKAGIRKGDVVVGMNGDRVIGPATLTEMIHASKAGETVKLDVMRDGRKQTLSAELGERKDPFRVLAPGFEGSWMDNEEARRAVEESMRQLEGNLRSLDVDRLRGLAELRAFHSGPRLGIELVRTTPELRRHLGAPQDQGVLVGKVLPGSVAEKAGIKVGDVVVSVAGAGVASAGDILEVLSDKSGEAIDIELVRDGKPVKVRAEIPKHESDEPTGPRARVLRVGVGATSPI